MENIRRFLPDRLGSEIGGDPPEQHLPRRHRDTENFKGWEKPWFFEHLQVFSVPQCRKSKNELTAFQPLTMAKAECYFAFFLAPKRLRDFEESPRMSATLVLSSILAAASRTSRNTP